jgi:hypothetical protein
VSVFEVSGASEHGSLIAEHANVDVVVANPLDLGVQLSLLIIDGDGLLVHLEYRKQVVLLMFRAYEGKEYVTGGLEEGPEEYRGQFTQNELEESQLHEPQLVPHVLQVAQEVYVQALPYLQDVAHCYHYENRQQLRAH